MSQGRNKDQRIGVFVDVQNLYYSAKNLYNKKVNFNTLLKEAIAERKLVRAIAYVIKADVKDKQTFYTILGEIGFEVRTKDLQVFYGGAKKGDWDVGITLDVMEYARESDIVVLASGDGDFDLLVKKIRHDYNSIVEVYGVPQLTAASLINSASRFVPIEERLLLKSVNGELNPHI